MPICSVAGLKATFLFLTITSTSAAQTILQTRIVHGPSKEPAAFATVRLLRHPQGVTTDGQGRLRWRIPPKAIGDSLLISGIGLAPQKIAVRQALQQKLIWLNDTSASLASVVVTARRIKSVLGAFEESAAYMRSWNTAGSGGEIGRVFQMPPGTYHLERVSFKVNTQCDTCLVRLRIRRMQYELPGTELLTDSITTWIYRQSHDDPNPYFDLSDAPLAFEEKRLFVSLEVIECRKDAIPGACSLSFVGTEHGFYWYKMRPKAEWESFNDYGIYMKLYLSHDEEPTAP